MTKQDKLPHKRPKVIIIDGSKRGFGPCSKFWCAKAPILHILNWPNWIWSTFTDWKHSPIGKWWNS